MTEQNTPKMTHNEMIDVLKGLVFGTFDRTTAKEREALDMAISALSKNKGEDRPKGEWELFGFPTSDDILYCQEEFICSECRDFKVNRYMRATYNFCPNCGADMRGKAE